MEITQEYDQKIVDKISNLIKPEYLNKAKLILQVKSDSSNSIRIILENNPWRNGVVKGNSFFANIKSYGKITYINFKNEYAYYFTILGIKYTANKSEITSEYIRIKLSDFIDLLEEPTADFINMINEVFLNNISFPQFGCCSKYEKCKEQGECLHIDQLYATACQWQKHIKRTDKIDNP